MTSALLVPLLFGIVLGAGCDRYDSDFDATAELSANFGTVATVKWTTEKPGTSWVEFGSTVKLGQTTVVDTELTTDHEVMVVGLPPSTTAQYRAFSTVDGEELHSAVLPLETGPNPRDTPDLSPSDDKMDPADASGGFVTTTTVVAPSYALVLDAGGNVVWALPAGDERVVVQARPSTNGTDLLYNLANSDFAIDSGEIVRVRWDGTEISRTRTPWGHHDFVELGDGKLAYIAADVRDWTNPDDGQTYTVVGDSIREIDEGSDSEDGGTVIWDSWDGDIPVVVDVDDNTDIYPQGLDWTHCNNLVYLPDEDAYLLSVHNMSLILKIDRASGQKIWQLGGDGSDFTRVGDGRDFYHQHSPEITEDGGIRLFDNGNLDEDDPYSEAVEFSLDESAHTYQQVWHFDGGKRHTTYLLGDHDGLPNGNHLITWGNAGLITEVTDDGDVVWQVDASVGNPLGFTHHAAALGGVVR